jgi:hypothetical protein
MQESTVYHSIWRDAQKEEKREIAIDLLRRGVAIDIIAPSTGLSIRQSRRYANEEVQQLQQQSNNSAQI